MQVMLYLVESASAIWHKPLFLYQRAIMLPLYMYTESVSGYYGFQPQQLNEKTRVW